MRFFSAYFGAFAIVQGVKTVLNRRVDITEYGLGDLVIYNFKTVACSPVACNGIQPYEWVALPLAALAAVWFVGMPLRHGSLTTP